MYQDAVAAQATSAAVLNIASVILASASLIVSLIAFRVTKTLTKTSIAAPLALQELYEMNAYFDGRKLSADLNTDWDRFVTELDLVRRKDFILRKTGFGREVDLLEEAVARFVNDRKALMVVGTDATEADGKRLATLFFVCDESLQALLKSIRGRLDELYADPFLTQARSSR